MKLIVHIGTHKTGSTLFQNVSKSLSGELIKSKIFYPIEGFSQSGHHELAWALMSGNEIHAMDLIYKIKEDAKKSGCHTILLSSEEFEFVRDFKLVKRVFAGFDVELIVYLRRQDKYLESEYNQHVKMYDVRFDQDIFKFYMFHNFNQRFSYSWLLNVWKENLTLSFLHVKSFDQEVKSNNLLSSFFNCLGGLSALVDGEVSKSKSNVGLPSEAIIYLARLNRVAGLNKSSHLHAIKLLTEMYSQKKKNFLDESFSKRLVDKYRESNNYISRHFNNGVPLFDNVFDKIEVVDFYNDFDDSAMSLITKEIGLS